MMNKKRLRDICAVGFAAALLCALSPIGIPIGSVPLSLSTLVILICAGMLGPWKGTAAVLVYLVLGCVGLPVFSGFSGGIGHLIGPSGGFLVGYAVLSIVTGLGRGRTIPMICGSLLLYAVGTVWYMIFADVSVGVALLSCVVPYLPLDAVKIAVARIILKRIKNKTEV